MPYLSEREMKIDHEEEESICLKRYTSVFRVKGS